MRPLLLALALPAICLAQAPLPRLALNITEHDFGRIAPDRPVSYRFRATNTGTGLLTITKLNPTCGCTSTVVGRQTLAPGESTELEVTFNPAGQSGVVHKSVQVVSDDPTGPTRTLNFTANVLPAISPGTQEVLMDNLVRTDRRLRTLTLESGTGAPIHVDNVELSPAPWLGVATEENGKQLRVELDMHASLLPPEKLEGFDTITLRLANPAPYVASIRVHWAMRPPVTVTPARVAWAEPAGQERRAELLLASPQHQPFRVLAVRTSNPLFTVSAPSGEAAEQQKLAVLLSASAAPGHYEEKAFLTLDTPGHPELEVRLSATLR